jgi:hypothetical protein
MAWHYRRRQINVEQHSDEPFFAAELATQWQSVDFVTNRAHLPVKNSPTDRVCPAHWSAGLAFQLHPPCVVPTNSLIAAALNVLIETSPLRSL